MWENRLKNVESDNNKILYETLLDFFFKSKRTYFLSESRTTWTFNENLQFRSFTNARIDGSPRDGQQDAAIFITPLQAQHSTGCPLQPPTIFTLR